MKKRSYSISDLGQQEMQPLMNGWWHQGTGVPEKNTVHHMTDGATVLTWRHLQRHLWRMPSKTSHEESQKLKGWWQDEDDAVALSGKNNPSQPSLGSPTIKQGLCTWRTTPSGKHPPRTFRGATSHVMAGIAHISTGFMSTNRQPDVERTKSWAGHIKRITIVLPSFKKKQKPFTALLNSVLLRQIMCLK